jgi:Cu(I)/Ag(I) efflux system membrane fusion protein
MNILKIKIWLFILFIAAFLFACNNNSNKQDITYTCPMPQDSVFSNKPGKCPKCGMELIKMENNNAHERHEKMDTSVVKAKAYTCPMHPQVQSNTAGSCPICGMQLEKVKSPLEPNAVSLNTLLKPANQQVIASVPMVHMMDREEDIEMDALGFIAYDTRQTGVISSNFSGRIERLYVKYRYQKISSGQKIMDIYSPELLTAQETLLFLVKNDPENAMLINSAKQKLLLLGMNSSQLNNVIRTGKSSYRVSVYSKFSGHIQESSNTIGMNSVQPPVMNNGSLTTAELSIKEGMYVQKGQNIFSVYNPNRAWALLNIFAGQAAMVKVGNKVRITPETAPEKDFRATINYIEPFYREGNKTLTVRVYFDNAVSKIPIGSQVKATIFAGDRSANWLPEEAVLSLGMDNVVFVRNGESFTVRKIETGIINKHLIQVLNGLDKTEAVAANAQYLIDSESFIKTNQ